MTAAHVRWFQARRSRDRRIRQEKNTPVARRWCWASKRETSKKHEVRTSIVDASKSESMMQERAANSASSDGCTCAPFNTRRVIKHHSASHIDANRMRPTTPWSAHMFSPPPTPNTHTCSHSRVALVTSARPPHSTPTTRCKRCSTQACAATKLRARAAG